MTAIQYLVSVLLPLVLAGGVWIACRRPVRPGWVALALFLGVLSVLPVIRIGNVVEPRVSGWTGHVYPDELIRQLLATALPEEWGKGAAAVLVWWLMRKPVNPLSWLSCAAAAHCGFAIVEGVLGTFGNEGLLKVLVGRSLGAVDHCAWGIIAAWFAWRGWQGGRLSPLHWSLALLLPAVLHSLCNAATMETPGDASTAAGSDIPLTDLLIVLAGLASLLVSWTLAAWCVHAARRAPVVSQEETFNTAAAAAP